MHRPLPPFRVKPVRSTIVRRTIDAAMIREWAAEASLGLKSQPPALRVAKSGDVARLKVLGRAEAGTP
jgi:hypothetical protein